MGFRGVDTADQQRHYFEDSDLDRNVRQGAAQIAEQVTRRLKESGATSR